MIYKSLIIIYALGMSTTIPVSRRLKKVMERLKGEMTWEEFLEMLIHEVMNVKRERARARLRELLTMDFEEVRVRRWSREY